MTGPDISVMLGLMKITDVLRVEHRLLRVIMETVAEWLSKAPASASAEMRVRVGLLFVAVEDHAQREEQYLFAHLRPLSDAARHLVDMMELVHDEVRGLFEEIETMPNPKEHIWTILDLTETHFVREDEEVFPLAEELLPEELLLDLASQSQAG
jgi:hemerythrin superfamily protein